MRATNTPQPTKSQLPPLTPLLRSPTVLPSQLAFLLLFKCLDYTDDSCPLQKNQKAELLMYLKNESAYSSTIQTQLPLISPSMFLQTLPRAWTLHTQTAYFKKNPNACGAVFRHYLVLCSSGCRDFSIQLRLEGSGSIHQQRDSASLPPRRTPLCLLHPLATLVVLCFSQWGAGKGLPMSSPGEK